jgi:hypothetical protein
MIPSQYYEWVAGPRCLLTRWPSDPPSSLHRPSYAYRCGLLPIKLRTRALGNLRGPARPRLSSPPTPAPPSTCCVACCPPPSSSLACRSPLDLIMGWVGSSSGHVVSDCRVKILDLHPTCDIVGSGHVGFRFFSYNFWVRSGRVGFFLNSGENFGLCPTRRMVELGPVFFGRVGSGLSGRADHDQVYSPPTVPQRPEHCMRVFDSP